MEIKVKGIETPDGNIHTFIPPSPTETERGGIKAKAKTNETVEVVVGSDGKLYVPAYPTIDKTLASSGKAADSKVVGDKLTEVNTEITALKKSVSDGKSELAVAITEKGVETASNDAFHVMAENVKKIESKASFDRVIVSLDKFMINTSELGCRVIASLDKFMINTSTLGCNVYLGEEV